MGVVIKMKMGVRMGVKGKENWDGSREKDIYGEEDICGEEDVGGSREGDVGWTGSITGPMVFFNTL